MGKFWNSSKTENDFDVASDYYNDIGNTGTNESYEPADIYGEEFGIAGSDIEVVVSSEDENTLYKVLYAPEDAEDRGDIVDSLMAGRVVVINVADMDKEDLFRLFDYVMGALQVLGGEMKRYNKKVVALFPAGVDVETPLDEIEDEPYDEEDGEEEFDD